MLVSLTKASGSLIQHYKYAYFKADDNTFIQKNNTSKLNPVGVKLLSNSNPFVTQQYCCCYNLGTNCLAAYQCSIHCPCCVRLLARDSSTQLSTQQPLALGNLPSCHYLQNGSFQLSSYMTYQYFASNVYGFFSSRGQQLLIS